MKKSFINVPREELEKLVARWQREARVPGVEPLVPLDKDSSIRSGWHLLGGPLPTISGKAQGWRHAPHRLQVISDVIADDVRDFYLLSISRQSGPEHHKKCATSMAMWVLNQFGMLNAQELPDTEKMRLFLMPVTESAREAV